MARRSRRNLRNGKNKKGNSQIALAYSGPPSVLTRMRCPDMPPALTSNLVVRKVFRFVLSSSVTTETAFTFTAAKLCSLISIATATTNLVQLFEAVKINSITLWSSINPSNVQPRSVAITFTGASLGVQGTNAGHSDMSVGMTRVAKVKARPEPNSQAAQYQSGVTSQVPQLFQLNASGGAVCDIDLSLIVTPDLRSSNASTTITGPATVTQIYWLALDNNGGGSGSGSNQWTPPPDLITIT